jgi:hypothetical protein
MACYRCNVDGCTSAAPDRLVHYQFSAIGIVQTRCMRCFRESLDTDRLCNICSVCGLRCFYDLRGYGGACYSCYAALERHPKFHQEYIRTLRLSSFEYWDIMAKIDRDLFCVDLCDEPGMFDDMLCDDDPAEALEDVIVDDSRDARSEFARFDARIKYETVNKMSIMV